MANKLQLLWIPVLLGSGFLVAWLACRINGIPFGLDMWPLIACVDLFAFCTLGFFSTEGKTEILYGAGSMIAAACTVVQLAILF